jgi:hypothetical protein
MPLMKKSPTDNAAAKKQQDVADRTALKAEALKQAHTAAKAVEKPDAADAKAATAEREKKLAAVKKDVEAALKKQDTADAVAAVIAKDANIAVGRHMTLSEFMATFKHKTFNYTFSSGYDHDDSLKTWPVGGTFDHTVFPARAAARDATSPRWYIHVRNEDLLCEPDGLHGVNGLLQQ